jgi:hypothetical protein
MVEHSVYPVIDLLFDQRPMDDHKSDSLAQTDKIVVFLAVGFLAHPLPTPFVTLARVVCDNDLCSAAGKVSARARRQKRKAPSDRGLSDVTPSGPFGRDDSRFLLAQVAAPVIHHEARTGPRKRTSYLRP